MTKRKLLQDIAYCFSKETKDIRCKIAKEIYTYYSYKNMFPLPESQKKKKLIRSINSKIRLRKKLHIYNEQNSLKISLSDLKDTTHPPKTKLREIINTMCQSTTNSEVSDYFSDILQSYEKEEVYTPFHGWIEDDEDFTF